jgi:hypothetical protein
MLNPELENVLKVFSVASDLPQPRVQKLEDVHPVLLLICFDYCDLVDFGIFKITVYFVELGEHCEDVVHVTVHDLFALVEFVGFDEVFSRD